MPIGLLAEKAMTGGTEDLFYGGGLAPLGKQLVAVVVVAAYAFAVTYGLGKLLDKALGFRASEEQEHTGLDLTVRTEAAYDHGVLGRGAPVSHSVPSARPEGHPGLASSPLVNEGDSYGSRRGGSCFITDCPPGVLR